jgi:hypothetical protein
MTILEALQSMTEYENDNLLAKALIDRGVSDPSATYTAADQQSVELSAADVYLALVAHPEFREGSRYENYAKGALMSLRREILRKWGATGDTINTPGIGDIYTNPAVW